MSQRPRRHRRVSLIRAYGMALGFALGQVGPFVPGSVRPRPAIVRDMDHQTPDDGFDELERLAGGTILTIPLEVAADTPLPPPGVDRFSRN